MLKVKPREAEKILVGVNGNQLNKYDRFRFRFTPVSRLGSRVMDNAGGIRLHHCDECAPRTMELDCIRVRAYRLECTVYGA